MNNGICISVCYDVCGFYKTRSLLHSSIWTQSLAKVPCVSGTTWPNSSERLSPPYHCINICHKQPAELEKWQPGFRVLNNFLTSDFCTFICVFCQRRSSDPFHPHPQQCGSDLTSDLCKRWSTHSLITYISWDRYFLQRHHQVKHVIRSDSYIEILESSGNWSTAVRRDLMLSSYSLRTLVLQTSCKSNWFLRSQSKHDESH